MFRMLFRFVILVSLLDLHIRFDGRLSNLGKFEANTEVQTGGWMSLFYVDVMRKNSSSEANVQGAVGQVLQPCNVSLHMIFTIKAKRNTKVRGIHQPALFGRSYS